jgi:S-adenosylmethionine-dependent methyltransferase
MGLSIARNCGMLYGMRRITKGVMRGACRKERVMLSVADAYNRDPGREWERLARNPYRALEFELTMQTLARHLPASGAVLDAGGGPGRYALALCRLGYEVTLLDISSGNIALAREQFAQEPEGVRRRLVEAVVGDICDLSRYPDGHFNAVVALGGPLSHLPEEADRRRAVSELVRVTANADGIVALTGIGYLALLREIMTNFSDSLIRPEIVELLRQGKDYCAGMLWHFFRADELRALAESCGLTTVEMVGCQGLSTGLTEATNRLRDDPARWAQWMIFLTETASEPAVVDMAEHILYIGRKP